jgi:hypothetical protein
MQTFGPWPAWKFPNSDARIPQDIRILYVVDLDKSFIIMVLRTNAEDLPVVIGRGAIIYTGRLSESYLETPEYIIRPGTTILDLLERAIPQEQLSSVSAKIYGTFDDLMDQVFDISALQTLPNYPTIIFALPAQCKSLQM